MGKGGVRGSNGGQRGQFTSNLGLRRTIPVTAGRCQVSRSGEQRGSAMYKVYYNLCRRYVE
jgi:hypothetical protein